MLVTEQVKSKFSIKIQCKNCKSENVDIHFYAGFIHDCGGDTGSLSFECNDCRSEIDIDDDD